jgi:hypothetical protein
MADSGRSARTRVYRDHCGSRDRERGLLHIVSRTRRTFARYFHEAARLLGQCPLLLVITPVLTAVLGTMVTRALPYDYVSVMLAAGGGLSIVLALRSPIAPAISAGLLPLALGVTSLWYPPGIVFGTILLAVLSSIWKRMSDEPPQNTIVASEDEDTAPGAESYWRLLPLLVLVLAAVFVVKLTNLRFVLFPPLVVVGFEMFLHTKRCPWATRYLALPVVCLLTAAGGLFCRRYLGVGAAARSSVWRGEF